MNSINTSDFQTKINPRIMNLMRKLSYEEIVAWMLAKEADWTYRISNDNSREQISLCIKILFPRKYPAFLEEINHQTWDIYDIDSSNIEVSSSQLSHTTPLDLELPDDIPHDDELQEVYLELYVPNKGYAPFREWVQSLLDDFQKNALSKLSKN